MAAEVIGLPNHTIGMHLYNAKGNLLYFCGKKLAASFPNRTAPLMILYYSRFFPVCLYFSYFIKNSDCFAAMTQEFAQKLHQDLMLCGEERTIDLVAVDFLAAGTKYVK